MSVLVKQVGGSRWVVDWSHFNNVEEKLSSEVLHKSVEKARNVTVRQVGGGWVPVGG